MLQNFSLLIHNIDSTLTCVSKGGRFWISFYESISDLIHLLNELLHLNKERMENLDILQVISEQDIYLG